MRRAAALSALALAPLVLGGSASAAAPAPAAGTGGGLATYGNHLYGQYCLACHGANGEGNVQAPGRPIGAGPLRAQGQQQGIAPSLRGVGALAADFYLRTGYMPLPHLGIQPRRGRVLLSELQIRALVAYVASLGKGPPVPAPHPERGSVSQGMQLFTEHCAGCHQIVAQGGYVSGAVPPPLEDDNATQIAEAVRIGPYVMPKFSTKAITSRQLDSIVAYVQFTKDAAHPGGWPIGYVGPIPEGLVTWFIAAVALVALCVVIGKRARG